MPHTSKKPIPWIESIVIALILLGAAFAVPSTNDDLNAGSPSAPSSPVNTSPAQGEHRSVTSKPAAPKTPPANQSAQVEIKSHRSPTLKIEQRISPVAETLISSETRKPNNPLSALGQRMQTGQRMESGQQEKLASTDQAPHQPAAVVWNSQTVAHNDRFVLDNAIDSWPTENASYKTEDLTLTNQANEISTNLDTTMGEKKVIRNNPKPIQAELQFRPLPTLTKGAVDASVIPTAPAQRSRSAQLSPTVPAAKSRMTEDISSPIRISRLPNFPNGKTSR